MSSLLSFSLSLSWSLSLTHTQIHSTRFVGVVRAMSRDITMALTLRAVVTWDQCHVTQRESNVTCWGSESNVMSRDITMPCPTPDIPLTTGWRRPIRCLKLQVILRKRATNHRALLWKITCKDTASYESLPPCTTRGMSRVGYGIAWQICNVWDPLCGIRHPMSLCHLVPLEVWHVWDVALLERYVTRGVRYCLTDVSRVADIVWDTALLMPLHQKHLDVLKSICIRQHTPSNTVWSISNVKHVFVTRGTCLCDASNIKHGCVTRVTSTVLCDTCHMFM